MLYPQNGDRIVAIDSVTALHPMYRCKNSNTNIENKRMKKIAPYLTFDTINTLFHNGLLIKRIDVQI